MNASLTIRTSIAAIVVLGLWPVPSNGQGVLTPGLPAAPAGQADDHAAHPGDPAKPTPQAQTKVDGARQEPGNAPQQPGIPPITDADRVAAFPDVRGHTVHERAINSYVLFDQLEWQRAGVGSGVSWDNKGWIGGDRDRFWFRTEGDGEGGRVGSAQAHLLYGRAIARWWDVVAGIRQDVRPGPAQTWAAIGIQGLAPQWFEVQATAYVGASGRTHVRLETEYELLLTNRLVLQPLVEVEIYGKSDPEHGIGAGLSSADAGLRLRYEVRREFAPYVGLTWNRKFFETADFAEAARETSEGARLALGVRVWF